MSFNELVAILKESDHLEKGPVHSLHPTCLFVSLYFIVVQYSDWNYSLFLCLSRVNGLIECGF